MSSFRPTHTSHKAVEAHPIAAAEFEADGSGKVALKGGGVVSVPPGFASRGVPAEGDMLVRYAPTASEPGGYLSHSPRAVFDDGYNRILDAGAMSFGDALFALKMGSRICRQGWNGKGMWLSLSGPLGGRNIAFENFWSSNNSDYARQNGGSATVLPCITMKTATGEILMGWLASQTDMLADDWMIVADD